MGADGHIAIYNYDMIYKESRKRDAIIQDYFEENDVKHRFGYVYPNFLGTEPKYLLFAYWDTNGYYFEPLGDCLLIPNDPNFNWSAHLLSFIDSVEHEEFLQSLGKLETDAERAKWADFIVWCKQYALLANYEIWT